MPQRLIVLILVPTIAAVALAGVRISSSVSETEAYGRVERMAELGVGITRFVQEFTAERDLSVEYSAAGRAAVLLPDLEAQQKRTDAQLKPVQEAAAAIDGSYGAEAVRDARAVQSRLDGVTALRSLVVGSRVPAYIVLQKYTEAAEEMIGILDGISQNVADGALAESSRALGALARAKEAVSRERALLLVGARVGALQPAEMTALTAARAQEDSELASFRGSASVEQNQLFEDTVVGTEVDQARVVRQRVISAVEVTNGTLPRSLGTARSAEFIRTAMTSMIDKMRVVEQDLADDIKAQSDEGGAAARQSMIIDVVTVVVLLALVLLLTIVMARSLVRPLRRLQSGALDVASARLPGLVDRLRDPEAAVGGIEVEPIDIDSTDEIGQVARAFDEVHREAVRLAADEAVLRGNINAMFVNLSRRSQSLIERQLRLIEELEQSERDEEQLANLFRLDHLATRMRRNNENLLVLGGQEQVRRWRKPVPLIDVVRASLSEVEQYERVSLRVQGDMTVAGPAVNDLVHLLAELVENATTFSSEHTKVTVSGQLLSGGGSMLQITDNGVGMAPEELEQANWRLVNPPVIDFGAARRMGLFVVGRLAVRHGIRVELRAAQGGGLTAFVVLPDAVVSAGESGGIGARGLPGREAAEQGPLATLTAPAEAPAIGATGAFQQDGTGTAGMPALGSGPSIGGTGPLRPLRGVTGPQPTMNDSGPFGAPGGTGAHAARPATGPLPRVPADEPARHPAERPTEEWRPDEGASTRRPGELPVRQPGAQLPSRPGDDGGSNGLFEPRNEQPEQTHERPDEPGSGAFGRPGGEPVVPEAQPVVPEPRSARHIPWETGPLDQLGDQYGEQTGAPADQTIADGSLNGAAHGAEPGWSGSGWSETAAPAEPVRPDAAAPQGFAGHQVDDVPERPAPEPSMFDRPAQMPAAPPPAPPAPPQAQAGPPRMPERSPIFDAMQSEWFQRRSGETVNEDPVKGWESPADAGFRAAEAAREPVAEKRTSVGLPKRVPGKNRVPGAVGKPGGTAQPPTVPAADPAAGRLPQRPQAAPAQGVQAQGTQGQDAPAQGRPEEQQGPGQSADVRRNRFASLQRGVNRGRTETRGGTSGEAPSQDDGETGGTR